MASSVDLLVRVSTSRSTEDAIATIIHSVFADNLK